MIRSVLETLWNMIRIMFTGELLPFGISLVVGVILAIAYLTIKNKKDIEEKEGEQ